MGATEVLLLAPNIKGLTLLTQTLKLVAELDSYYLVLRRLDDENQPQQKTFF
jgi:hypothetical protein